jgi:hypothetical protein
MNNLHANFRDLPNLGVIDVQVPANIMAVLKESAKKMMDENFNKLSGFQSNLVGHINNEFVLGKECRDAVEPLVTYIGKLYDERWNYMPQVDIGTLTDNTTLELQNLWINFQQKHEFNPTHTHTGVYSFVIWIKIPYKLADEDNVYSSLQSGVSKTSRFTLHYNNILGMNSAFGLPVDQDWEGKMLFFPAALTHSVYPFYTSDEYRISIAGNLKPSNK